jgi:predicted metal-binding protein
MEKYLQLAREMGMLNAKIISTDEMVFDHRVLLKCRWGCENHDNKSVKCQVRNTSFEERLKMITSYNRILLLHANDSRQLSRTAVEIERQAFLDGHHLSFAIRYCNLCKVCALDDGKECVTPLKVRPCEGIFGIDVYRTARRHDLPIYPLKDRDEVQNRYAFVCID